MTLTCNQSKLNVKSVKKRIKVLMYSVSENGDFTGEHKISDSQISVI